MEPATKIIRALGGATAVSKLLDVHRTQVSRWRLSSAQGGTDGRVPQRHHLAILSAAERLQVAISAEDLLPARCAA